MSTQLSRAQSALHYSCAAVATFCVAASIFLSLCRVNREKGWKRRRRRRRNEAKRYNDSISFPVLRRKRPLYALIWSVVLSYFVEEITILARDGLDHTQPQSVHLILLSIEWSIIGVRQRKRKSTLCEPAGLLSFITAGFEIVLLTFFPFHEIRYFGAAVQLAARIFRLISFFYLLAIAACGLRRRTALVGELQPILRPNGTTGQLVLAQATYGTEPLLSHHAEAGDDYADDDDDSFNDTDQDSEGECKDDAKVMDARAKRLQETGSWLVYFQDFSIFLPYLIPRNDRKVQLCFLLSLLCMIVERFLVILIPRQLGIVTDQALTKDAPYRALGIWVILELVRGQSGIGLIMELVKIPIHQFSYRQITNAAFGHVMSLSMDFHAERDSAEVMKAVEQGGSLNRLLESAVLDVFPTTVDLAMASGILLWKVNAYASLVMLLASIAYVSTEVFTSNWNIENRREMVKTRREQSRVMHQAVQGWQTVSYFNQLLFEQRKFGDSVDKQLKDTARWGQRDAYGRAVMELLTPMTFFTIACLVLYEISHGRATPGDFVFFLQYWDTLAYPLKYLSRQYRWLMSDLVDAERLLMLFKTKPSVVDHEGAIDISSVKGRVTFENVRFAYNTCKQPTITDINIDIKPGQTVALVGMTGSGKSTIFKLLLRFYDVTSGQIKIDGYDIRDITLNSLRESIGIVPQDPLLFNATVMENLRYARRGLSEKDDEEVFAACRAAAVHDKILTFPDGYNTTVGEQGVKLSGGELQRIAIARVFLKKSPILLLDEATSAVDTNTESEIQDALDRLKSSRTTFVIAHRLSTIIGADQILVLHEGRIVDSGTHEELLQKDGRYKGLWEKQIKGKANIPPPTADEETPQDQFPPGGSSG